MSRQALVALLIACFLRATLPFEAESFDARRAPASGAAVGDLDFPCAGHRCGCHTREHCLAACCCFPHRVGDGAGDGARDAFRASDEFASVIAPGVAHASERALVAELALRSDVSRSSRTVAFIQALKCAGGAPRSVANPSTFFSTEPQRAGSRSIDPCSRADERIGPLFVSGLRPVPLTPPLRARTS